MAAIGCHHADARPTRADKRHPSSDGRDPMAPVAKANKKTERITIRLQPKWLEAINYLVDVGRVDSVSSAVRNAVREYVERHYPQAATVKATDQNVAEMKKLAELELMQRQLAE